ncbi:GNAT family N-acetyltransferase [Tabrizicola sp. J26]|uniref:ACT domain-containing protein n=1 Tax=Alitabrizicola rongguiensis TaxID=2909234 RepID=UPI001F348F0D|nr:ACT domain-containing protein [Tabrizicola rongguiensis]MCF1709823.1 GNAT family N-acetyltransferase [Tabrizicola rongguiensis]
MTQIRTPRLTLRRARKGDLTAVHALLSNPRLMRYWSTPEHETIEQTCAWLDGMVAAGEASDAALARGEPTDSDDFLIEYQGRVIGKAGAWKLPEVGFLIATEYHGQGLMREAMEAMIAHLFARHPIPRLVAEADPRNAASIGLLTRLGFVETHRAERTMQWRDEWCDSVYFALDRPNAPGIVDLSTLIAGMEPELKPGRYVFATTTDAAKIAAADALMRFREAEGTTLILTPEEAARLALDAVFPCRMITLNVTSSLQAIGFLAAITAELAKLGMGVNPVSGFHHDHLFVPEDRADQALAALRALSARNR